MYGLKTLQKKANKIKNLGNPRDKAVENLDDIGYPTN